FAFLETPENADLWSYCNQPLADFVHARRISEIAVLRERFQQAVKERQGEFAAPLKRGAHSITVALAWAIIVDSALLNDHLIRDMKETASSKGIVLSGAWLPYFLPNPPI